MFFRLGKTRYNTDHIRDYESMDLREDNSNTLKYQIRIRQRSHSGSATAGFIYHGYVTVAERDAVLTKLDDLMSVRVL